MEQAVTKLCCSPQGLTARTKDRRGVVAVQLKITTSLQR